MKSKGVFSVKPDVRKFRDSVERPGEFIFGFVLMEILSVFLLTLPLWVDTAEADGIAWFFVIGIPIVLNALIVLTVVSVKRAHASMRWRAVAALLVKEGYLKKR